MYTEPDLYILTPGDSIYNLCYLYLPIYTYDIFFSLIKISENFILIKQFKFKSMENSFLQLIHLVFQDENDKSLIMFGYSAASLTQMFKL